MFNLLKNLFGTSEPEGLENHIQSGAMLIDVRTPMEFNAGHAKGSLNIPLDQVGRSLHKLKNEKTIIVFCRSGNRSGQAKLILEQNGFKNVVNAGPWENVSKYTG